MCFWFVGAFEHRWNLKLKCWQLNEWIYNGDGSRAISRMKVKWVSVLLPYHRRHPRTNKTVKKENQQQRILSCEFRRSKVVDIKVLLTEFRESMDRLTGSFVCLETSMRCTNSRRSTTRKSEFGAQQMRIRTRVGRKGDSEMRDTLRVLQGLELIALSSPAIPKCSPHPRAPYRRPSACS